MLGRYSTHSLFSTSLRSPGRMRRQGLYAALSLVAAATALAYGEDVTNATNAGKKRGMRAHIATHT